MLVAGFPGIGKTAVVHEVHKPITRQRGYFIQGKFDQLKRNIPFSAFVEALRDLMGQLLSEGEAQREQWKTKILNALGDNAQVIVEVIPELERILGPQPAVPELSGDGGPKSLPSAVSQIHCDLHHSRTSAGDLPRRFAMGRCSFSDPDATIDERQPRMSCLLLIGAYRDNEVSPAHPLRLTLAEIEKSGTTLNTISLGPAQPIRYQPIDCRCPELFSPRRPSP